VWAPHGSAVNLSQGGEAMSVRLILATSDGEIAEPTSAEAATGTMKWRREADRPRDGRSAARGRVDYRVAEAMRRRAVHERGRAVAGIR
jgi:hypothetical protein